jgi:hypothetical protein
MTTDEGALSLSVRRGQALAATSRISTLSIVTRFRWHNRAPPAHLGLGVGEAVEELHRCPVRPSSECIQYPAMNPAAAFPPGTTLFRPGVDRRSSLVGE